jgi:serine/threonine protein kinase
MKSLPSEQRTIGPFRLDHQLGQGGFAPVWMAREVYGSTELRTVAIKLFASDAPTRMTDGSSADTAPETARIIEEARAICQVEHPNVVRFFSICHDPGSHLVGLVMEYVSGTALDVYLLQLEDRGAKMGLEELLNIGVAIASALSAVHQVGLVHRDVKPANVIEATGVYKLIDFGVASSGIGKTKARGEASRKVVLDDLLIEVGTKASQLSSTLDARTSSGLAFPLTGTMGYVDPHCVATGAPATASSDLYALGATLFECATGRVPAAMAARVKGAPGLSGDVLDGRAQAPPLATCAPELPPRLARLVDALLDPSHARRPKSAEAVAWELEGIRREVAGHARPLPPEDVGPFRGLGRFEQADRDVYFGRTVEIAASLEMARSRGLIALIGASGSGKSSLARAGVLPAIADGGLGKWPKAWDVVITAPGADARGALVAALAPFVEDAAKRTPESLMTALGERVQSSGRGVCLLVDQLEELVTVSDPEGRDFAARLLGQIASPPIPGVRCIVAARRDLLDPLLSLGDLGRVLTKGTLLVTPMIDTTWGEVLDQALSAYGYSLEDDALRTEVLEQLESTVAAMPLVQFALTQLWERRDRSRKIIPRAALKAIGGIAGALDMHAEATLASIQQHVGQKAEAAAPHADQAEAGLEGSRHRTDGGHAPEVARRVLLAMTTAQGTRRSVERAEIEKLDPLARTAIDHFEASRLIVQETQGLTLAHEALLTQWKRLHAWIAEARSDRLMAEDIEGDAEEWAGRQEVERLWKKRRLVAAEDLARRGHVQLGEKARAFLRAGRAAERRERIRLGAAIAFALLLVGVATTAYVIKTKAAEVAALRATTEARDMNAKLAKANTMLAEANAQVEADGKKSQEQAEYFQRLFEGLSDKIVQADSEQLKKLQEQADKALRVLRTASAQQGVVDGRTDPCGCNGDLMCLMQCSSSSHTKK